MENGGSEAESTKNQGADRNNQEYLENDGGRSPPLKQREPDGQRERACHALGKPAGGRGWLERDTAWPAAQGRVVQSVEGVQTGNQRAPPKDSAESQKDSRLLQDDGDENDQTNQARLEVK